MAVKEKVAALAYMTPVESPEKGTSLWDDYAECRRIMRAASKNYSFASNVLPPDKLHHVEALYALMRVGDDRVDVSYAGFPSKWSAIDDWEQTYWRAFEQGTSHAPVLRAYLTTALTCGIPKEVMATYFRAMKEDITITRFETFEDLIHYMDGSAIPVGRAMMYILGVRRQWSFEDALPHADSLSIAMQLSNFWRDVGYDYRIGRIYLPLEDMANFGVSEDDIAQGSISTAFIDLLEYQIERTETYYAHAFEGVRMLASGRWAVMSGLEIYRAILLSIRENEYDVFSKKSGATTAQMIGLVIKSWLNTRG
ncbi:MAG: phytoene/squalene synthase family protein [Anaerolineae bacterium]